MSVITAAVKCKVSGVEVFKSMAIAVVSLMPSNVINIKR